MPNTHTPIKVFYSYAHEDESHLKRLHTHLSMLRREGLISVWHDRQIGPGTDWAQAIDTHLEQAAIILLLVSPDFLDSDYCYAIEMQRALQRHNANEARVIPIILRPCDWSHAPFTLLQCLPRDGKAITLWDNQDLAWDNVTAGIRQAIENHPALPADATPQTTLPPIWNIPYQRNPVFTGREQILQQIADTFKKGQITALSQTQAISGLGGIGKTQTAIEYAYQHHQDYQAVLWTLADTRESLISGYVAIARLLNLPEKDEKDQTLAIKAVLRWLTTHSQWLLILDNADDLTMAKEFLPTSAFIGPILLTTRARAMGRLAQRIEVDTMPQDTGALFLLRRASLIPTDALLEDATPSDIATAKEICEELGGLPLALDQAGAYIEETQCALSDYKNLYHTRSIELLKLRGGLVDDHPKPVATTWSLSFEQLEQKNPAAADLLRFCAFLAPDAVPEEIITAGAEHLGPVLQPVAADPLLLNNAIAALGTYSLISRDATEKTLSIHRLVQVVLRDVMDEATQQDWLQRAVLAVNEAFPKVEFTTWPQCERCLPHALVCAELIEQENFILLEAASLLNNIGWYLDDRARYSEAESVYERALAMREHQLGPEHLGTASILNNLALLYNNQGKYELAERLYVRALTIYEQQLGDEHPSTASSLNNLAALYYDQRKYTQAQPLYERALAICEQQLGPLHPNTATNLDNLAGLYRAQGKYSQAEPLHIRALAIREQQLGPLHPHTANSLNNLALLYKNQGKYSQAEPLFQRALTICEQTLGPQHPDTVPSLYSLASLYQQQHRYTEAKPLYQRALQIWEHVLGPDHPSTQSLRKHYGSLLRAMGREAEAIEVEKRGQDTPPES